MTTVEKRTHRAVRAEWEPIVEAGDADCAELICLEPDRWIAPGSDWDLAHGDTRDEYRGPAHARCNRSEGGKRGWWLQGVGYARTITL